MLSRTADSLFWMARYIERAENMARLVDMGRRMSGIPGGSGRRRNEWPSVLAAAGVSQGFAARQSAEASSAVAGDQSAAIAYLMLDKENPSSVVSCIDQARGNARAARAALTREMWEALNDAWIEARSLSPARLENGAVSPLIEWVKGVSAQFRGATDASALRNDGFEFLRLGLFIERMDSSARLLDVKSFAPAGREEEQAVDQYQWVSILLAAGVVRAYHAMYRADYEPARIARFLIKERCCPRSLAYCADRIGEHLGRLAVLYGERPRCHAQALALAAVIDRMPEEAFDAGALHGVLSDVIGRNNRVALTLAEDYHFAPPPSATEAPTPIVQGQSQSQTSTPSARSGANGAADVSQRDLAGGAATAP